MAGYVQNVAEAQTTNESRWIPLKTGTHIVRILPPCSSYFDPEAPPLDFFYYEKKTIWKFPSAEGPRNIVVDKDSLVLRSLRAYEATLGNFETRKAIMKDNGMSKYWPQLRGAFNVITADKQDQPYWLELPKTALRELVDKIKEDPSVIDLERGRFVKIEILGETQTDKTYKITVSKKSNPIEIKFDVGLLDDLKQAVAPTDIGFKDITDDRLRDYAKKILIADKEAADLASGTVSEKPSVKAATKKPEAPPPANNTFVDEDDFDSPAPKTEDDDFGMEEFEAAAQTSDADEDEDLKAFQAAVADDDFE